MSRKEIGYCLKNGFVPHYDGVCEYSGFPHAPTANTIKRRGKVCILNFNIDYVSGHYITSTAKIIVPEECRPKTGFNFPVHYDYYLAGNVASHGIGNALIKTNGEITLVPAVFALGNVYAINFSNLAYEI